MRNISADYYLRDDEIFDTTHSGRKVRATTMSGYIYLRNINVAPTKHINASFYSRFIFQQNKRTLL